MGDVKDIRDVVIVGGGVSGLFAAYRLIQCGAYNVTLLEAGGRLGGRINTIPHGRGVLDLGAQWVHGKGENPLWKFILKNKIKVSKDYGGDGDGKFYLPGGVRVTDRVLKQTLDFLEEIHDDLDEFAGDSSTQDNLPLSVGHFFQEKFQEYLVELDDEDEKTTTIRKTLFDWFMKWEAVDTGVDDLKNQSVLSWGEYVDYESESDSDSDSDSDSESDDEIKEPILEGGYGKLVQFLVKQVEGKVEVLTDHKVDQIQWGQETVKLELEQGGIFHARHVIVTVSLGVLKERHQTLFSPPLPKKNIEAIEMMRFGLMNKIFLEFEKVFWDRKDPGIQILNPVHKEEGADEDDISQTWSDHIPGFDKVCAQPKMLSALISGRAAAYMESLTEEEVGKTCWELLKRFVGPSVPSPVSCRISRWQSEENVKGSYSYRSPLCDSLGVGPWSLATPICNKLGAPQILFGGEATDTEHYGTVTGAMMAGIREGDRLVQLFEKNRQQTS